MNVLLINCLLIFSEYPLRPEFNLHEQKTSERYSEICGYHFQHFGGGNKRHHHLDANAMEFIPKAESADSGNGSGSSSEEDNSGSEGRFTLSQHQLFYASAYGYLIDANSVNIDLYFYEGCTTCTNELNANVEEYVLLKLNTCYIIIVNRRRVGI